MCWHDSVGAIDHALQVARSVRSIDDAHLDGGLRQVVRMEAALPLFGTVDRHCTSFSQWWKRAKPVEEARHFAGMGVPRE